MYKRKFPKTKTVENEPHSQLLKMSNHSLSISTASVSNKSSSEDMESQESPPIIDNLSSFHVEKKRKTDDILVEEDTTDAGSEPLFDDNDDMYSFLNQTLMSCGLHLKCNQNVLCK